MGALSTITVHPAERIVCFGDSITDQGFNPGYGGAQQTTGWAIELNRQFAEDFNFYATTTTTTPCWGTRTVVLSDPKARPVLVNSGVAGDSVASRVAAGAAGVTSRITNLNPGIIQVALGANDSGSTPATFDSNYRQLLDLIVAQNPGIPLMLVSPIMHGTENVLSISRPDDFDNYETKLVTIASDYGACLATLHSIFYQKEIDLGTNVQWGVLMVIDPGAGWAGHPNTAGMIFYEQSLRPFYSPSKT